MEGSIEAIICSFIIIIVSIWSINSVVYLINYQQANVSLSYLQSCAEEIAFVYMNAKSYSVVNVSNLCDGKLDKGIYYYVQIYIIQVVNGTILSKIIYQGGKIPPEFVDQEIYYAYFLNGNITAIKVNTYGEV
jgi:hypothetical protein